MKKLKQTRPLFPRQLSMFNKVVEYYKSNQKGLVVAPCTFGKSEIVLNLLIKYANMGMNIIVCVHSVRIVKQLYDSYMENVKNSELYASYYTNYDESKPILFTTMQSALRLIKKRSFDFFIIDECHYSGCNTYQSLNTRLLDNNSNVKLLGLTATAVRYDNITILSVFKKIIDEVSIKFVIDNDYATPIDVYIKPLSGVRFINQVVSEYIKFKNGVENDVNITTYGFKTVLFVKTLKIGELYHVELKLNNISSKLISCKDRDVDFNDTLERFKHGDVEVLITVNMISEGVNLPMINCGIFTYYTSNKRNLIQKAGRVVRLYKGKTKGYILDYGGSFSGMDDTKLMTIKVDEFAKNNQTSCSELDVILRGLRAKIEIFSFKTDVKLIAKWLIDTFPDYYIWNGMSYLEAEVFIITQGHYKDANINIPFISMCVSEDVLSTNIINMATSENINFTIIPKCIKTSLLLVITVTKAGEKSTTTCFIASNIYKIYDFIKLFYIKLYGFILPERSVFEKRKKTKDVLSINKSVNYILKPSSIRYYKNHSKDIDKAISIYDKIRYKLSGKVTNNNI